MNPTTLIQNVLQEIESLNSQFDIKKNNSEITSESGRVYKVANVIKGHEEGTFIITEIYSMGMFPCNYCDNKPKWITPNKWTQYTHGEDIIRIHQFMMHLIKNHPDKLTEEYIKEVEKIFIL